MEQPTLLSVLIDAWHGLGRCFRRLGECFAQAIRLTWRRWYIVVTLLLLGGVASVLFMESGRNPYRAHGVLVLNGPTDFSTAQALCPLEQATTQAQLSAVLGSEIEATSLVGGFRHYAVIDLRHDSVADFVDLRERHNRADTVDVVMTNRLAVSFLVTDKQDVPAVEKALVAYLCQLPAMQAQYQVALEEAQREAELCRRQVALLDTFTYAFYMQQGGNSQLMFEHWKEGMVLGRREVKLLHPDLIGLQHEAERAASRLSTMTAPVVVETAFVANAKPVIAPAILVLLFCFVGWLLGVVLALVVEQRKAILAWLRR